MKVGLVGCGAIGATLARAIINGEAGDCILIAVCDVREEKMIKLRDELSMPELFITTDVNELLSRKDVELVIEAASQRVIQDIGEKVLSAGKNMVIMSVGALSDLELLNRLKDLAKERGVNVFIPSGAICGIDGVKSASVGGLSRVEIRTTKHPHSLEGAPYLIENNIDLSELTSPLVVFKGSAKDAARGFPMNVNVAVTLSLAGIGVEKTIVTIVADPDSKRTKHEIFAEGEFGKMTSCVENLVHPKNPKTSYLSALSVIRTLKKITEVIQIGT